MICCIGQTETVGNGSANTNGDGVDNDFLTRERAALGDDAAQFASAGDNARTMQDGEDDLLGGGGEYDEAGADGEKITEFESSFPAVDTSNDVCGDLSSPPIDLIIRLWFNSGSDLGVQSRA